MTNCQWRRRRKKYSFCGVCNILKLKNPKIFRVGLGCLWAALPGLCHLCEKKFFPQVWVEFLSFSKWPKRLIQPLNLQDIVRISFFLGEKSVCGFSSMGKRET